MTFFVSAKPGFGHLALLTHTLHKKISLFSAVIALLDPMVDFSSTYAITYKYAYVRNHVQVCRRPDLELRELECITLELTVPSPITRHLLFCCYRPPDQHPDTFSLPFEISWPRPKMNCRKLHSWGTSMQNTHPGMKHQHPTQLAQK